MDGHAAIVGLAADARRTVNSVGHASYPTEDEPEPVLKPGRPSFGFSKERKRGKKMIRCRNCGKLSERGTPTFLHVTKTREKVYENGGWGFETVEEVRVCSPCNSNIEREKGETNG